MLLLDDPNFLIAEGGFAILFCGFCTAMIIGMIGKPLLGIEFRQSFLLTIIVLVGFCLSQAIAMVLIFARYGA